MKHKWGWAPPLKNLGGAWEQGVNHDEDVLERKYEYLTSE
jgi:hypothetical protein